MEEEINCICGKEERRKMKVGRRENLKKAEVEMSKKKLGSERVIKKEGTH